MNREDKNEVKSEWKDYSNDWAIQGFKENMEFKQWFIVQIKIEDINFKVIDTKLQHIILFSPEI